MKCKKCGIAFDAREAVTTDESGFPIHLRPCPYPDVPPEMTMEVWDAIMAVCKSYQNGNVLDIVTAACKLNDVCEEEYQDASA